MLVLRVQMVSAPLACSDQCGIQHLSLSQDKVQVLWKTSCLVLVAKKSASHLPSTRLLALTSNIIKKVLERLILAHLRPQVNTILGSLQFVYRP